ncbi:unnamed protein product [Closterium sp. NIES-54]
MINRTTRAFPCSPAPIVDRLSAWCANDTSASPRPVCNELDVDDQVDGGGQVGSGKGMRVTRGVIRVTNIGVGGMQEPVSLGERSRVRFPVYAHVGRCRCLLAWGTKKSVMMLHFDRGGEFLGKACTNFVDQNEIVHNLTCPHTPQQNSMAEREMCTVFEAMRAMLLHMGVKHHCNVAGKLASNAQWGLHLGVLQESKSWEVLDLTDNKDITTVEGIFYEPLLLEVWKIRYGPASGRTHANLPMDSSMATSSPSASPPVIDLPSMTSSPSPSPHIINLPRRGHMSATGDEGRLGVSLMASARGIASGQHDDTQVGVGGKPLTKKEQ